MAITLTKVGEGYDVHGTLPISFYDVALDNSYGTGGYAVTAAQVGLKAIMGLKVIGGNAAANKLAYHWNTATGKLMCMFPTGGATAAPTTLASAKVTTGASSATAVNATTPDITPGIQVEVGATTDVSTITVRCMFIGLR